MKLHFSEYFNLVINLNHVKQLQDDWLGVVVIQVSNKQLDNLKSDKDTLHELMGLLLKSDVTMLG